MKQKFFVGFWMLVCCSLVWADQAAYITKEQAERAVALLKDKGEIKHHCAACDDKAVRSEAIRTIEVVPTADAANWEVKVNGTGIDLAYVYFLTARGEWKNVAQELAIKVEDVPAFLPAHLTAFKEDALAEPDPTPQTAEGFLNEGSESFGVNNYDKAIENYAQSLQLRESALAYQLRGVAHFRKKNYEAALADLNKAIQMDASDYTAFLRRAQVYEAQGKKELADADKQEGAKRFREKAATRTAQEFFKRAQYFAARHLWGDAIRDYSEAIKLDANYAPAYEKRAKAHELTLKWQEALADYNKFIELQPDNAMAYYNRAGLLADAELLQDKDYTQDLLRDYSEFIKRANALGENLKPLYIAYISRAEIYQDQKEWDKALADYTAALKLKPKDTTTFIERGNLWLEKKSYDKAIRDYDYALVLDPKSAWAYNGRGSAYRDLKLNDKALSDYSKSIELSPKYTAPLFSRAGINLDSGKYDEAITDYTKLIEINAKGDGYFNNRGIAYLRKKEWDKAIGDFDEAIKLNPKNVNAFNNRGVVYRNKEEWDKAVAEFTQAIALDANYISAYTNRAFVYRKQNKNDLAEADEKKANEIKGKTPVIPAPATPPAGNFDDDEDFFF